MLLRKLKIPMSFWFIGLIVVAISGCTSVQLISNYDEEIDRQAQDIQKKFDVFFIGLQNSSSEDLKYKSKLKFYESALADLNSMEVRASGIYLNSKTIEQIKLAKINLAYIVLLNKKCIDKKLSEEQVKKVKDNGIDLSMECKVDNGASSDVSDRGDVSLNRALITPMQGEMNQLFGAIMALELAKKRGETKFK